VDGVDCLAIETLPEIGTADHVIDEEFRDHNPALSRPGFSIPEARAWRS